MKDLSLLESFIELVAVDSMINFNFLIY